MSTQKGMLSVIMPAYKEEQCIYKNLLTTCECIATFCPNYEIIVINDGSPDNTFVEAMRARSVNPHIKVATYKINRGKGGAIKEGISRASGEFIAFLDADLDLSPMHLKAFLKEMYEDDADIVIGSKLHKDSKIEYPFMRRIMSYGYYIFLKLLFHLDLKDTQTGVKLFRADIIKPIAESLKTSGYAFDIEILARATHLGCRIAELPVHLEYQRGMEQGASRIRLLDVCSMFFDTLKIFWDIKIRS